jgi:hypothetical protein
VLILARLTVFVVVHYMYLFEVKLFVDLFSGYGRRDAVEHLLAVGANVHARDDGGLVNMASIFIDDIKLEYHQLFDHKSFFILYLFCSLLYHRIFPEIYYVDKKSFAVVNFIL